MRPIKFRGRVPGKYKRDGGRIVYGSLVDYGEGVVPYRYWIHPIGSYDYFPVDEDSIAQLVGYDAHGAELYEGDKVLRYDNEEEFAETPENGRLEEIPFYTELDSPLDIYYIVKAKEATL